jgi:hypothetical protein
MLGSVTQQEPSNSYQPQEENMARKVNVTKGAQEQAASSGGDYKPLDAGIYNVSVFEAEGTAIKNPVSPNNGVTGVRLHLRISDGQKGANRRLFTSVYDVERWNPKPGKTEGAVNFQFFQFYKALGIEFGEGEVELPEIEDLQGEELAVKVKIVHDSYAYNKAVKEGTLGDRTKADFLTNEVAEFLPVQDLDDLADDTEDAADEDAFDL